MLKNHGVDDLLREAVGGLRSAYTIVDNDFQHLLFVLEHLGHLLTTMLYSYFAEDSRGQDLVSRKLPVGKNLILQPCAMVREG